MYTFILIRIFLKKKNIIIICTIVNFEYNNIILYLATKYKKKKLLNQNFFECGKIYNLYSSVSIISIL